jgi:hypothetical protein
MPEDDMERAFFELQDAKVNFMREKTLHTEKMDARKEKNQTFTNGFGLGTQTTMATQNKENAAL